MDQIQTVYALLRDGTDWEGTRTHLEIEPDGALVLQRLPGPANSQAVDLPGPYAVNLSGIALDNCNRVYLTNPETSQLLYLDQSCNLQFILPSQPAAPDDPLNSAPGHFLQPRGLLLQANRLLVADSGNGRIQVLRLPSLEVSAIWTGLSEPTALAAAQDGKTYVLDRGLKQVLRLLPNGMPDSPFSPPTIADGFAIASFADGTFYVSDLGEQRVKIFQPDGISAGYLPNGGPAAPGALAARASLLYIADRASGRLWIFDRDLNTFSSPLTGYRGPVSAMAIGEDGRLVIKPGMGETIVTLDTQASHFSTGRLEAGPLDAGQIASWVRVSVSADLTQGSVDVYFFTSASPSPAPVETDWQLALSQNFLLQSPASSLSNPDLRYLWLRLDILAGADDSPRLLQVQAETGGEDWMDFLPAVYRRKDADQGDFLRRWLASLQSEMSELEELFYQLHRWLDPISAPLANLEWLASWLGFELPFGLTPTEQRELLGRVMGIYQRRGTRLGLADWVELYTGVRPLILEDYRERHLWLLEGSALLGFETGLAPALPDGMVIPEGSQSSDCVTSATQGKSLPEEKTSAAPPEPWTDPSDLVIGEMIVGQSRPISQEWSDSPLFTDTAHRFTVLIPAAQIRDPKLRHFILSVLDSEKPAHTDYRLCFIEPEMRVGFQAQIGVDTIIAGPPTPAVLEEAALDLNLHLGGEEPDPGSKLSPSRTGQSQIGRDFVLS